MGTKAKPWRGSAIQGITWRDSGPVTVPSDHYFDDADDARALGSTYDGWQSKGVTTPVKTCVHRGDAVVFTAVGARELYGARGHDARPALYDVVLDCAGAVKAATFLETRAARYASLARGADILRLHWPDRAAPPVAPAWWAKLARALPKRSRILVACIGSHGRTGTCLALLAMAYDVVATADAAVAFVRAKHCKHAVESKEQVNYLKAFETYLKGETK